MNSRLMIPFQLRMGFVLLPFVALTLAADAGEEASFFRGLNLNGPSVVIDGNVWQGQDAPWYECHDREFENQNVPLIPATDSERATMIRSSRYGGNRVQLNDLPPGTYTLFLYVWEDNDSEVYSISVNHCKVVDRHTSGAAGRWDKLGPLPAKVQQDGKLVITSQGGTANFSGLEIWSGQYDGLGKSISSEELAFFEQRIRPLLVERCYECHSADASEAEAGLLVDSRATLRSGGANGPAVVPGDLDHSLLIRAVRYDDEAMQMPPDEKLSDAEIADLEHWVKIGAPDPRSTATVHLGKQIDPVAAREFWSLRPIADPPLPAVQQIDWPRTDLDRFVLARLEQQGLSPAADADRRVWIRRVTYDLIGLPPTTDEVDDFLTDDSPQAFSRVVDRLLASPHYGERWGRHWLDVVRYADTAGDNSDFPIPQIHRYRDWVIDAMNQDLPYDEFVSDQIAGDLRGGDSDDEQYRRIIATGYLANARRFGSRVDDYPQHLTIEDTIDNLGRCFLGMTLSCARCHDHKFDPITQRDYYALYGIFHSTRYPWPGIELDQQQRNFVPLVPTQQRQETSKLLAERAKEQKRLSGEIKKLKEAVKKANEETREQIQKELEQAEQQSAQLVEHLRRIETAYAVVDADLREDVALHIKGDPARLGDIVERRFLTVLGGDALPPDADSSGRQQLVQWIMDPENPLTARVMVNRIWQHHFGRGLVPTPNDFGKQGIPPTHPELLDHLATQFRQQGWSIKAMHRTIMLSRTYRQSSQRSEIAVEQDPTNQWLSAFPRRRLDAESLRDTLLMIGDDLDLSAAGPHPFPEPHTWTFTQHNPFKAVYDSNHRSVYLMTQRIQRHPFLAVFDGADPSASTANRMITTTPLQALFLLNDPLVHQQSERVAKRVMDASSEDTVRIQYAYRLLFAREVSDDEQAMIEKLLHDAKQLLLERQVPADEVDVQAWHAVIRSLFRLNEFVYLD